MIRDGALTGHAGDPVFARDQCRYGMPDGWGHQAGKDCTYPGRATLDECPNGCGTACDCLEDDPECE